MNDRDILEQLDELLAKVNYYLPRWLVRELVEFIESEIRIAKTHD